MDNIIVDCITSPPMDNNTFIIHDEGNSGCIVIDPSGDGFKIIERIEEKGLCPELILLTHGHYDHISSLNNLISHYHCPVAIHEKDAEMLIDCTKNLSCLGNKSDTIISNKPTDKILHDGDEIQAAGVFIKVLHTPGHTEGSCCFLVEDILFTGDTLFRLGVGRTDLPGGDQKTLLDSINRLFSLEGDYTVLPGHMRFSTLDEERKHNVFMKNYSRK